MNININSVYLAVSVNTGLVSLGSLTEIKDDKTPKQLYKAMNQTSLKGVTIRTYFKPLAGAQQIR